MSDDVAKEKLSALFNGDDGIESAHTVLRGTLRYKGYSDAMQTLLEAGLFSQKQMDMTGYTWVQHPLFEYKIETVSLSLSV